MCQQKGFNHECRTVNYTAGKYSSINWWLSSSIIRKLRNSVSRGRHMKESFKILRQVSEVYFYFLGPVIVPETTETVTETVSTMTDAAVTITATVTESTQLESTTSPSPSEVKSIKSTSHKWTTLSYIFCQNNAEIPVCPSVAHANVQGCLFSWKKSGSVKQEGVSRNINQSGPLKIW